jgi:hypothetical protein
MAQKKQSEFAHLGYSDTPILEDSGYHVHDGERPQPPIVTPGEGTAPPSDATVLFDGTDLGAWEAKKGGPAGWKVEAGYMEVVPGTGGIRTKESFGTAQLHLEFACPEVVKGESQGRGNSGVFLQGVYEIQVLDNYDNPTYPDGTVGGIYGQYPPLANAIRKPGEWNEYDIVYEAPEFDGDKLVTPAYVTVLLNHVVLHHRKALRGPTNHKTITPYTPHGNAPLELQDHGDLVRYRNIWIRDIGEYDS